MGPEVSIPLGDAPSGQERADIDQWLRSLEHTHFGTAVDGAEEWTLRTQEYGQLGIEADAAAGPSEISIALRKERDLAYYAGKDAFLQWTVEEEKRQLRELLGFDVTFRLYIEAVWNSPIIHVVLAHLAIELATRLNAMIDMHTKVAPRAVWDAELGIAGAPVMTEDERIEATRSYLRQFPGRVLEMHSWVTPERRTTWHLVDVEFLEAWMKHPDFYM